MEVPVCALGVAIHLRLAQPRWRGLPHPHPQPAAARELSLALFAGARIGANSWVALILGVLHSESPEKKVGEEGIQEGPPTFSERVLRISMSRMYYGFFHRTPKGLMWYLGSRSSAQWRIGYLPPHVRSRFLNTIKP
jgi:hypothetical protein